MYSNYVSKKVFLSSTTLYLTFFDPLRLLGLPPPPESDPEPPRLRLPRPPPSLRPFLRPRFSPESLQQITQ